MELRDLVQHGSALFQALPTNVAEWSLGERYHLTSYGETLAIEAIGARERGIDISAIAGFLARGLSGMPADALLQVLILLLSNDHFTAWYSRQPRTWSALARAIDDGLVRWKQCLCVTFDDDGPMAGGPLQVALITTVRGMPSLPSTAIYLDLAPADLSAVLETMQDHARLVFAFTNAAAGKAFTTAVQAARPAVKIVAAMLVGADGVAYHVGYSVA